MSLTPNSVAVPAQSKSLDTSTVTTAAALPPPSGTAADITIIFE